MLMARKEILSRIHHVLPVLLILLFFILFTTACAKQPSPGQTSPINSTTTTPANNPAPTSTVVTIKASVTRVIDGDTVNVAINGKEETVRMIGVNTPETHHPEKPVEPYGPEAENYTRSQLTGKTVYLEKDVQERDKYGRLLAYVWLEQPSSSSENEIRAKMYNAKLLLGGYAQVMTVPPNVKYADLFVKLQVEARSAGKGLWGLSGTVSNSSKTTVKQGPGPNGESIKGNINSKGEKIYHVPGGQFYDETIPERWFFTEEEAQAAGYKRSKR